MTRISCVLFTFCHPDPIPCGCENDFGKDYANGTVMKVKRRNSWYYLKQQESFGGMELNDRLLVTYMARWSVPINEDKVVSPLYRVLTETSWSSHHFERWGEQSRLYVERFRSPTIGCESLQGSFCSYELSFLVIRCVCAFNNKCNNLPLIGFKITIRTVVDGLEPS